MCAHAHTMCMRAKPMVNSKTHSELALPTEWLTDQASIRWLRMGSDEPWSDLGGGHLHQEKMYIEKEERVREKEHQSRLLEHE